MNKKALRKELEQLLVKTIEGVLTTRNNEAAKKIKKTILQSSKAVSKKFYKALKTKASIAKKQVPSKTIAKKPVKSAITKAKAKVKK